MGTRGTSRNGTPRGTGAYASAHRQKRRWFAVLGVLAALVVFVTVYVLMTPAATLTVDGAEETAEEVVETDGEEITTDEEAEVEQASVTTEEAAAALPDGAQVPDGYTEQYSFQDETNGVAVTVYAPEGVVPEDATLSVALLSEDDDAYAEAEEALAEDAEEDSDYGFAALDIHFEDAEGNEVEPSGDAYVVINANGLLSDDADTSSVTVQHLAEDESGAVASVDTVADIADETDGVVSVSDDTSVQAAFTVDCFSMFTISWASGWTTYFTVNVYYVDTEGSEIQGTQTTNLNASGGDTFTLSSYAGGIDGYSYSGAHYDAYDGDEVASMTFTRSGSTRTLTFYNEDGTGIASLTYRNNTAVSANVYLVYTQNSKTVLYITDSIRTDGMFNAEFGSDVSVPEGATVTYTWYRCLENSDNDDDWTKVTLERVTVTEDNLSADRRSVNVALDALAAKTNESDESNRYWYKVKATVTVTKEDGNEESIDYVSDALQVPYYMALQNGSFESPKINNWNNQLANGTEGLVWLTTGTKNGQDIEIARATRDEYAYYQGSHQSYSAITQSVYSVAKAADGYQFAELNCEAYGALYQDVMTVPGSTLYWQLSHAARQGQDTMALVIMPVDKAENLTETLETLNQNGASEDQIREAINQYEGQSDVYIQYFTDDTGSWTDYSCLDTGSIPYEVSEGQYLTRFFFVAISTGSRNATVGNLLDDVGFSTTVPAPTSERGQLTVTKVVDGYTPDSGYSVMVKIVDSEGNEVESHTFDASSFIRDTNNSTYQASWTYTINNMTAYQSVTYTVIETVAGAPSNYSEVSTVKVGDGNATSGKKSYVTVEAGGTSQVTFTNKYSPKNVNVTINKVDSTDGTSPLANAQFKLYYLDESDIKQWYKKEENDEDVSWTTQEEEASILSSEADGTLTFEGLDPSKTYYLVETAAPNGYQILTHEIKLSWQDGGLKAYSDTSSSQTNYETVDNTVTVPNTSGGAVLPETGGSGISWFTFGGVALIAAAACGYGFKRSRERRYDRS